MLLYGTYLSFRFLTVRVPYRPNYRYLFTIFFGLFFLVLSVITHKYKEHYELKYKKHIELEKQF
jgi:hypothetical protein